MSPWRNTLHILQLPFFLFIVVLRATSGFIQSLFLLYAQGSITSCDSPDTISNIKDQNMVCHLQCKPIKSCAISLTPPSILIIVLLTILKYIFKEK